MKVPPTMARPLSTVPAMAPSICPWMVPSWLLMELSTPLSPFTAAFKSLTVVENEAESVVRLSCKVCRALTTPFAAVWYCWDCCCSAVRVAIHCASVEPVGKAVSTALLSA
ncbi:hypothetical protein D3C85_579540 [compost metagenome]